MLQSTLTRLNRLAERAASITKGIATASFSARAFIMLMQASGELSEFPRKFRTWGQVLRLSSREFPPKHSRNTVPDPVIEHLPV